MIGCPRSGTSALAWGVAKHPDFWTSAESNFMFRLFAGGRLREAYQRASAVEGGWLQRHAVSFAEFAAALGSGIDRLFRSRSGGLRWVDASPENTFIAEDLAALFPDALFLHIVRDGRAVVCSMLRSGFGTPWANDFATACRTWAGYVERGLQFEEILPSRVLRVRQERLVEDTDAVCQEIQRFLGVEPTRAMAEFISSRRINSSYSPGGKRQPIAPSAVPDRPWEEWSARQHREFEKLAGEAMRRLGYWSE